jgi:hypothetical protein
MRITVIAIQNDTRGADLGQHQPTGQNTSHEVRIRAKGVKARFLPATGLSCPKFLEILNLVAIALPKFRVLDRNA